MMSSETYINLEKTKETYTRGDMLLMENFTVHLLTQTRHFYDGRWSTS